MKLRILFPIIAFAFFSGTVNSMNNEQHLHLLSLYSLQLELTENPTKTISEPTIIVNLHLLTQLEKHQLLLLQQQPQLQQLNPLEQVQQLQLLQHKLLLQSTPQLQQNNSQWLLKSLELLNKDQTKELQETPKEQKQKKVKAFKFRDVPLEDIDQLCIQAQIDVGRHFIKFPN